MSDFIFVSPTVKVREIDNSQYNGGVALGVTALGLLGETTQGPAFEPQQITNKTQFKKVFGGKSIEKIGGNLKYTLPYYADSFLSEGNNLFVTRILGKSGYASGNGYAIKVLANYDPATIANGSTTTGSTTYTGGVFSGITITTTGVTQTGYTSFTRATTPGATFNRNYVTIIPQTAVSTINGLTGTVSYTATTQTATPYAAYEGMVVGLLRSRGYYSNDTLIYNISGLTISDSTVANSSPYSNFTLSGTSTNTYTVSIDPKSSSYITKVLGTKHKDKTADIFVEKSYDALISKLYNDGALYGVSPTLSLFTETTEFNTGYKTPETPWIVSLLKGNKVDRLFRFVLFSDGNAANTFVKVSIANVSPETGEFDVIIRDFNDTDDSMSVLESYTRCSLSKSSTNFIGKRIGDGGENYDNQSSYVYLEFADYDNIDETTLPGGFEGYNLRGYVNGVTNTGQTPTLLYKSSYADSDKVKRVFLGISERAYDSTTTVGSGLNSDFFQFSGNLASASVNKTKGFHFDSGATGTYTDGTYSIGQFVTGADTLQTITDVRNVNNKYFDKNTRKFTVTAYGGFDGWDEYRDQRTITPRYAKGGSGYFLGADYQAWEQGIATFSNAEETPINLFATPGLNWSDNLTLVNEVVDLIENERGDFLYIMDSPDLPNETSETYASSIASLIEAADLDTTYACTYGPHIQILDTDNNVNVYIPPTGEMARAFAFTDNKFYSWFATAGTTRGLLNANKVRFKLKESARDVLYAQAINPVANFGGVIDVFGNKTLKSPTKPSALDRINVRRLFLYLGRQFSNIARGLLFEPNDDTVINQFLDQANPILNAVRSERGLLDAKITFADINDSSTRERNELYFNIYVKPVKSLEYIGVSMIISNQGASFANV
jgi:hypothetical protein